MLVDGLTHNLMQSLSIALTTPFPSLPPLPRHNHHSRSQTCFPCPQYDGDPRSISTKTAPICEEWQTLSPEPLFYSKQPVSFTADCLPQTYLPP